MLHREARLHCPRWALGMALMAAVFAPQCAAQAETASQAEAQASEGGMTPSEKEHESDAIPLKGLPATSMTDSLRESPSLRLDPGDKWLRVGLIWSSFALDAASTRKAMKSNPEAYEMNPILRGSDGKANMKLYIGIMLPVSALATYANLSHPSNKYIRFATYIANSIKLGIAVRNFSAAR